jgi:membrane protease YdiL (CAAX protease family)
MPLVVIAGSWMPALAAVIVTGTLDGSDGVRRLFAKFLQFRLPVKWYVAALIPFGLAFVAALIYKLAGGTAVAGVTLSLGFVVALLISTLPGAVGEEAGWRGFALPRLLEKFGPLKAGLVLGIIWAGWHLPVTVAGGYSGLSLLLYSVFFTVGIVSVSVVMTWIYGKTAKSLVPMVIAHLSVNIGLALIGVGAAGSGSTLALTAIMYSLVCLTAIVVWAAGGLSPRPNSIQSIPLHA